MPLATSVLQHAPGPAWPAVLPTSLNGGFWPTSHVQGIAIDTARGVAYFSFTTLLVKTDLTGRLLGTVEGITGHLGDIELSPVDGRVYASLEYKRAEAFYIAIIDVERVDRVGMRADDDDLVRTVHLDEVTRDFTAVVAGSGVPGAAPRSRYGCSGIDGVAFGPRFGDPSGPALLTVAYGIYGDVSRDDNDNQVLLQFDTTHWWDGSARRLDETAPHRSGPSACDGKYFVRTGNTTFGVQNLDFDRAAGRWLLGVYPGTKPHFPNYTLFAVEADAAPVFAELPGLAGERGMVLPLADDGLLDSVSGVRGWHQSFDVGVESLGDGLFYLSRSSSHRGLQTSDLTLHRWTGDPVAPFAAVSDTGAERAGSRPGWADRLRRIAGALQTPAGSFLPS